MSEYLTVTEAAIQVKRTPGRLRQELLAGNLKGEKIGPRAWIIHRADLAEWQAVKRIAGWPKDRKRKHPKEQDQ